MHALIKYKHSGTLIAQSISKIESTFWSAQCSVLIHDISSQLMYSSQVGDHELVVVSSQLKPISGNFRR